MKLAKFNYLYTDISYYLTENKKLLDKLNIEIDYENEYLIPFREELNKNFLKSFNKVDLVKFYLFELLQIQNQFNYSDVKLLFQMPEINKNYTKHENYIVVSHYLFDLILTEIQLCCLKYDIDFFSICNSLNMDLLLFDCAVAGVQENKIHNENPKYDNIFSNNGFILFDYILNNYVKPKDKRGRFSDIGFYYWKMYNSENQYIHQRPEAFKKWFFNNYDKEDIGRIKTLTNLKDTNRNIHYSTALDWFKTQNK
jgi:hypothetical protein